MNFIINMIFIFISMISWNLAHANELPYAASVSKGFRQVARIAIVNTPIDTKQISLKSGELPEESKKILDELFQRNSAKAILVARGEEIIYERFSFSVGRRHTPLGYSMSKSLTGLTVGKAICDGHISSINDQLKQYIPSLEGTSWGEATVENVLTMSSGAYAIDRQFDGHKTREMQNNIGGSIASGNMSEDFIELMRQADERQIKPGSEFHYSNFDTVALGLLVEQATKLPFTAYFENTIWAMTRPESTGAWFINNKGQTSTYNGFSARPYDWIRLGLMVLRELKNPDSCFGQFIKEATSRQVASVGPGTSYGYQIWVRCGSADFCFNGFGGQYLIFNVEKNIVIYQHATTSSRVVWQTPQIMGSLVRSLINSEQTPK